MKQEAFEAQHVETWILFEEWIETLSEGRASKAGEELQVDIGREFPALYRKICHHLSLARARRYSIGLQQRLNQLALDGHQHLYRSRTTILRTIGRFLANDFPAAFRRKWRFMLASTLLFYLPIAGMAAAVYFEPELIYSLVEPHQVSMMEEMYDPENRKLGRERESDTDFAMFGFYIYNNISIGFQTFAGGLVFGAGSVFYLGFNGLYFGAIASHLTSAGFTETFWSFVSGHSAFELTAITIFGGAGLVLGLGAIAPGRKKRWHAVRDAATETLPLVYGGILMLVAAAFVEAFWSSTTWPPPLLKYIVGGSFWALTAMYFILLGRSDES
jgi:uncharacterized membrane protein SpoIIM required for sporulation